MSDRDTSYRPAKLAVDANGFVWRVYPEFWSMAPSNPDNEPIPQPVTYYVPESPGMVPLVEVARDVLAAWDGWAGASDEWGTKDLGRMIERLREATAERAGR